MANKNNQKRYGVFYRSNGRWAGPYCSLSFTKYTINRNPVKSEIRYLANYVLKSRVKLQVVD